MNNKATLRIAKALVSVIASIAAERAFDTIVKKLI